MDKSASVEPANKGTGNRAASLSQSSAANGSFSLLSSIRSIFAPPTSSTTSSSSSSASSFPASSSSLSATSSSSSSSHHKIEIVGNNFSDEFQTEVEPRAIKLNSSDLSKRSFFEVAQTFLGKTIHDIGKGLKLKPLQALTADAGLKDPLLESIEPHFALFMSKLHADGCADLREHLRTFEDAINAFPVPEAPPEGALEEEMVKYTNKLKKLQGINGEKLQRFIMSTVELFVEHPFWSSFEDVKSLTTPRLWECLERYLVVKCYRNLYFPDKGADWRFQRLLQSYQFIKPHQLSINTTISQSLIDEMNFFKAPRNKLIMIANCSVAIFNHVESSKGGIVTSDEFLAVLSYIIIKAAPPNFISNVNFVADLRHESMLMSSWGYFLANFSIVINFILHLAPHQLETATTSEDEMTKLLESEWIVLRNSDVSAVEGFPGAKKEPTKEEREHVLSQSGSIENEYVDIVDFYARYPYWNKTVDDLTADDLSVLLNDYKRLALFEFDALKAKKKGKDKIYANEANDDGEAALLGKTPKTRLHSNIDDSIIIDDYPEDEVKGEEKIEKDDLLSFLSKNEQEMEEKLQPREPKEAPPPSTAPQVVPFISSPKVDGKPHEAPRLDEQVLRGEEPPNVALMFDTLTKELKVEGNGGVEDITLT